MKESLSQSIAIGLARLREMDLPGASLEMAREAFIDLTGVMLAGSREPVVGILKGASAAESGCADSATVLLDPTLRRSPAIAALLNGAAAHALDYDDVQFGSHVSCVLVPAILAEAETCNASGLDALRAFVAGYEVWGELHSREPEPYHDKGWHPTAVMGPVAAAAAVAFLRNTTVEVTRHALSMSASFSGGVMANIGSMTKPLHAGKAASAGVTAVELAMAGMTAGDDAIGGAGGLLWALSPKGGADRSPQTRIGVRWFSVEAPLMFKKYPVCFANHRPIDAILDMVRNQGLRAQEVADIDVRLRGTQARMLRFDRPSTGLEAKFSIQFSMACAVLEGRVSLGELTDDYVTQSDVQALFGKVRLTSLPLLSDGSKPLADRLVVTTTSGKILDSGDIVRASPHTRLKEKFLDCCRAGGYVDGERLLALLDRMRDLGAVRELAQCHSISAGRAQ